MSIPACYRMVNHIQSNYKEIVAEIIRWNEIMRGVYEFKPTLA